MRIELRAVSACFNMLRLTCLVILGLSESCGETLLREIFGVRGRNDIGVP